MVGGLQYGSLLYILALLVILYFLLIRPQQQRQKKIQEMHNSLKEGDRVITIGGIHGTIEKAKEQSLIIKISDNVRVEFQRTAIAQKMSSEDEAEK